MDRTWVIATISTVILCTLTILWERLCQPIHPFCHLQTSSPIPRHPHTYSGPGGRRPPGRCQILHRPPELGDHRWPAGLERAECTEVWPWPKRYEFTRVTSISPRTTVTPYPTSHSPAMVWADRKGFNPTKTKKSFWCKIFRLWSVILSTYTVKEKKPYFLT